MKKLKLILVMLLALALAFSLISCNEDKPCEHADENGDNVCDICDEKLENTDGNDGEVVLINNGEFNFQIVKGNDVKVETVKLIDNLVKLLRDDFGIDVKVVGDTAGNEVECEVLIGTVTSRGTDYKYNKYSLGLEGYAIQPIGTKVIVTAGGDETMTDVVKMFINDILKINEDTETIGTVSVSSENAVLEIQDNYRVQTVTVGGQSVEGYKLVVDFSINEKAFRDPLRDGAKKLQDFFYEQVGLWLDIVNIEDFDNSGNAIYLRGVAKGKAGSKGFQVKVDGKDLVIECAHGNKFTEAFNSYYGKNFNIARDPELVLKKYDSDVDITKVYYSDFDAVGDGITDDYAAIRAAHEFANAGGQTVYANAGKTYYINNAPSAILIKTDVDWNNCKIIIDDSNVTTNANKNVAGINVIRDNGMFKIEQDIPNIALDSSTLTEINALKGEDGLVYRGLESGENMTTNVGFAPGFPALLQLRNAETNNYLRYGYVGPTGSSQREIVLVDKDGNIDPSTPLLHDYTAITDVIIHRADTTPITIKNATIESKASRVNLLGGYYSIGRGITINRANVTLENIVHEITGEIPKNQPVKQDENGLSVIADGYSYSGGKIVDKNGKTYLGNDIKPFTGHSYGGIVSVSETHNTLVKNFTFQARTYYQEGTYDIGAYLTNKIVFQDCVQSNFFEAGTTKPNMGKCWGVAGTNYCKNMEYLNCKLTRYDAHSGVTNGKIIGGELAILRLIGGGDFIMDGVKVWAYSGTPFQLREDYGASFNGTITIKDVDIVDAFGKGEVPITSLISVPSSYWDMGYKTFMPSIIIDNLDIETSKKVINLTGKGTSNMSYDASHHYPYRDIYTMDPSDPATAGYKFHYEIKDEPTLKSDGTIDTSKPYLEKWIKENITDDGARFHGCEYETHSHGDGTTTIIVTDVKNQYLYYAPKLIEIKNQSDKSFKIGIYDCAFFKKAELKADRNVFVWLDLNS